MCLLTLSVLHLLGGQKLNISTSKSLTSELSGTQPKQQREREIERDVTACSHPHGLGKRTNQWKYLLRWTRLCTSVTDEYTCNINRWSIYCNHIPSTCRKSRKKIFTDRKWCDIFTNVPQLNDGFVVRHCLPDCAVNRHAKEKHIFMFFLYTVFLTILKMFKLATFHAYAIGSYLAELNGKTHRSCCQYRLLFPPREWRRETQSTLILSLMNKQRRQVFWDACNT